MLRAGYLLAAVAAGYEAWFASIGGPGHLSAAIFGPPEADTGPFVTAGVIAVLCLAATFAFLALKPAWWGKLLCVGTAITWLAFLVPVGALGLSLRRFGLVDLLPMAVPATILLLVGVAHQLVEPSFGGMLRRAGDKPSH